MASPVKERYGDRFIPSRTGNNWETNFNMISVSNYRPSLTFSLSKQNANMASYHNLTFLNNIGKSNIV